MTFVQSLIFITSCVTWKTQNPNTPVEPREYNLVDVLKEMVDIVSKYLMIFFITDFCIHTQLLLKIPNSSKNRTRLQYINPQKDSVQITDYFFGKGMLWKPLFLNKLKWAIVKAFVYSTFMNLSGCKMLLNLNLLCLLL